MVEPSAPNELSEPLSPDSHKAFNNAVVAVQTQTEDLPVVISLKKAKVVGPGRSRFRWRLWLTTLMTCFLYASPTGFHYVVLNNSKVVVEHFIKTHIPLEFQTDFRMSVIWSALNACMSVGCVVGSVASAYFADKYGRKFTLMCVANVTSIVGNLLTFLAQPLEYVSFLVVGRIICGLAAGFAQPIVGVYLMESCPPHLAGSVGSFVDTFLAVALTFTHLLATPHALGTPELWPYLVSLCIWLALVGGILYPLFPESPKYLLSRKNDVMGAVKSIRFFYDLQSDEKSEALRIAQEMNREMEGVGKPIGWLQAWVEYPRPLLISTVVGMGAVFCGHIALQSYSTQILVTTGMFLHTAQVETIVMGAYEAVGGLLAPIVNHYGSRRFVLLTTLFVCIVGNLIIFGLMMAAAFVFDIRFIFVAPAVGMVVVFSAIVGPFALRPIVASEVSPQIVRAKAVTLTMASTQTTAIIIQWISWPFFKMYGPYLFLLFAGLTFIAWLFVYVALPENPNKVSKQKTDRHEDVKYRRLLNDVDDSETSEDELGVP